MKTLSEIKADILTALGDTNPGTLFTDSELELAVSASLREISRYAPVESKETLPTFSGSRVVDISGIADLIAVDKAEYPAGREPAEFHNVSVFGGALLLNVTVPPDGSDCVLYCRKFHTLSDTESTLTPELEGILVDYAAGRAMLDRAAVTIDRVNNGGGSVTQDFAALGHERIDMALLALRRMAKPTPGEEYPL
jgi:hypothetical protein